MLWPNKPRSFVIENKFYKDGISNKQVDLRKTKSRSYPEDMSRSSRLQMFKKISFLKNLREIHRKTPVVESLFN